MSRTVGVLKETFPGERCVAIVPRSVEVLKKSEIAVMLEPSAGAEAGYTDDQYIAKGASIASREQILAQADILIQFRSLGANPEAGRADLPSLRAGQIVMGLGEPLTAVREAADLAATGVSFFAMELIPRTTRAQSMDVLSSLATISGYEAVLLAAKTLPKMFPMLMTAAGTITPAKVFVIGAGVAGLQAIATARRLGAVVSAYDVRPAVRDQIVSVGAKFISLDVEASAAEDKGGYAKAMDENFYRRQRELMMGVIRDNDIVITTAAVPGKKAPILVTREMVEAMAPGSVIMDVAAVRGGNCELTRPGETVVHNGVTILGPTNFAAMAPYHASQMFSANAVTFLKHLIGFLPLSSDVTDDIVMETLVTHAGEVTNPRVREALGLPVPEAVVAQGKVS
ncbi:MAG TPA: NAD(P) transhydrogenase subunit alpha [Bryobacteraceae bacterium]|nr:NAD(P) transhydrogenase subunit alpha [Bryobacteraceae bacterium]